MYIGFSAKICRAELNYHKFHTKYLLPITLQKNIVKRVCERGEVLVLITYLIGSKPPTNLVTK